MNISLREVTKNDCDLLFEWVNDPVVRENSFNNEFIKYEEHKKWFKEKFNSSSSFIYIALLNDKEIGQIRIDIEGGNGYIDYSIAKEYRCNGYGSRLLIKIFNFIKKSKNVNIKNLIGKVKYNNLASRKSFEKARYRKLEKEKYIKYYMDID
ncbi:hypothetical protein JCM16358_19290 [Halanaerocella petrolearia]